MSLVTVIVPIYNSEQYLKRCLESLIKQTYQNIEIILVDDGSTDSSSEICDEYEKKENRVTVYHNDNHGVSYSRNFGIDRAKGMYLLFVDSDDYIESNYVETLVNAIQKEKADLAICGIREILGDKIRIRRPRAVVTGSLDDDYWGMIDFLCVPVSKIYLRDIVVQNNIKFPLELNYAEDEVFNFTYYQYVKNYTFIDKPLYVYDHHKNSLSDKRNLRKNRKIYSYVHKMKLEKNFLDRSSIKKKERIIGEQGIRAISDFASLDDYGQFKLDARAVREQMYKSFSYNKIAQSIFSILLYANIYFPLYLGCKLRDYIKYR